MSFLPADPLNCEILTSSLTLQREISRHDPPEGPEIGAQQTMPKPGHSHLFGPSNPLPWVPDFVGVDFSCENNGVLVVGSSYNGFIEGYSHRRMGLADYIHVRDLIHRHKPDESCRHFIREFERQVINPDRSSYYGPILISLLQKSGVPSEQVCLTDLCKASFVQRGKSDGKETRLDVGHDGILRKNWISWTRFLGCGLDDVKLKALPIDWIWRRMQQCRHIVALGTIAEYGVLKVFHRMSSSPQLGTRNGCHVSLDQSITRDDHWKYCYADSSKKLSHWLSKKNWWILSDRITKRSWNLLPVYHPSSRPPNADPGYDRTRVVLSEMIKEDSNMTHSFHD